MTSEKIYNIAEQPAPTCPLIDEPIRSVKKALDTLKGWKHMDEDDLKSACDYAEWHLSGVNDEIEAIRDHVERVRAWGQEWKDLAKQYAPKPETSVSDNTEWTRRAAS